VIVLEEVEILTVQAGEEDEEDEEGYGYDPDSITLKVNSSVDRQTLRRLQISKWANGKEKGFEHFPHNVVHGLPAGMDRNGTYPEGRRRAPAKRSSRDITSSRAPSGSSLRRGMLRSGGRRRGRQEREIPSLSDHASQDYLESGAREGTSRGPGETSALTDGDAWTPGEAARRDDGRLRSGHRMVRRFNGSNFISKLREITPRKSDPITFFTIAAMESRQDRKSDLLKLVKNRLHVAFNFLLFRMPELHMESAILCKAGLGMTIVNNSDYKNAETVSTKTYHGHLTVHYGAIVTKRDWQLMLEDLRCNGYIQGKGTGFLRHPNDLLASSTSQGKRNRSFICYAQPIARESRQLPPFLSLSGQWEMPDVVPQNLPENGRLFHGSDWYDIVWNWHDMLSQERPKHNYYRTKGYTWPQVAAMGWHAEYNISEERFTISSHGAGHLSGSDYQGAVAVLNGDASWFDPPPRQELGLN
jgi:hypothetical protein